jgi:hypothetical protein
MHQGYFGRKGLLEYRMQDSLILTKKTSMKMRSPKKKRMKTVLPLVSVPSRRT